MHENAFRKTIEYYNRISLIADTTKLHNERNQLFNRVEEKEKELVNAPDLQTYKSILEEISEMKFEIMNKERLIREVNAHRQTFFTEEEREEVTILYNNEITPLIRRYNTLTKELDKALVTFEEITKDITAEMLEIEGVISKMTQIRMKLKDAKIFRAPTINLYAEQLTRGSRGLARTYPEVVESKLAEIKGFMNK